MKNKVINFDGKRMRELRIEKGLKIDDLYNKCHIKYYRFYRCESGGSFPTEEDAEQIAKALGEPLSALLTTQTGLVVPNTNFVRIWNCSPM